MNCDLKEDYVTRGDPIPIKWTVPEAILYQKYSTSSDLWSYGMLIYKIRSLGHKLGAPLEVGESPFKDLQETYT